MLEMNLKTNINNLNFVRYMEGKDSGDDDLKSNLESERTTAEEQDIQK